MPWFVDQLLPLLWNDAGDRVVLRKVLESVLLGGPLEFSFVLRRYRVLHFLHYRQDVVLCGNEPLDLLRRQLELRCRDLGQCAGREAGENAGHNCNGET